MIIIGIDPGYNTTGYGVITMNKNTLEYLASGVIKTSNKDRPEVKLASIYNEITKVLNTYKPNMGSIEKTFVNAANPLSSLKLRDARGSAMAALGCYGLTVYEYAPNEVKKYATGFGGADKAQMLSAIARYFPTAKLETHDAADALSIALCCCFNSKVRLQELTSR